MGITRVANVTGLDTIGLPVVMVCRPNSRSLAVSQGKGLDLESAKASGVMESVEAYHAEHITLPLKLASYEELRYTHTVVDVAGLPRVRNSIYHPNLPMLWIEGDDLLRGESLWVPYEMVHLNHTMPLPAGTGSLVSSSNGLASGNHLLEAISHAICELVERDSSCLWDLRSADFKSSRRIDPDSVDDTSCREVLDKFERAQICVAAWETTTDIGIPSFFCRIMEQTINPLRILPLAQGSGCHPAREVALLRALTEAAQSRLTTIAGARDDMFLTGYELTRNLDVQQRERAQMDSQKEIRDSHQAPTFVGETFEEDVEWELHRLQAAGIERVIFFDLTKQELNLPVVRVVVPGLEPHRGDDCLPGSRARALLETRP
jgi:YcaO-like protein with predicted kinase domain